MNCAVALRNLAFITVFVGLSVTPSCRRFEGKRGPNEAGPISALRTLSSAQELYNTRYGAYGTLLQLNHANMIDSVLVNASTPASPKSGYYYSLTLSAGKSKWSCVARPAVWDKHKGYDAYSTQRNYMVNETGQIYHNTEENTSEFTKRIGE